MGNTRSVEKKEASRERDREREGRPTDLKPINPALPEIKSQIPLLIIQLLLRPVQKPRDALVLRGLLVQRRIIEGGVDVVGFEDEVVKGRVGGGGGEDTGGQDEGAGVAGFVVVLRLRGSSGGGGGESVCEEREEGEEEG